ncbi:MAG: aromatic ring-hydroxylating dioxygenase subunit alpha [Saprospirales bacterium]|nr:MAG: aromatic ring-hydroxylating dioxygenase subunit alpha [Saprospirales bacterium]
MELCVPKLLSMNINQVIDNNPIGKAHTPTSALYRDSALYESVKENIFCRYPFWIGHEVCFDGKNNLFPINVYPGMLDEPLLLSKKESDFHMLSNVCTHRGAIIEKKNCSKNRIICPYHGRRWDLEGNFQFMPGFKEVENFPSDCDHLKKIALYRYNSFLWGTLSDDNFKNLVPDSLFQKYMYFFPFDRLQKAENFETEYAINCNWALYCENYLEGFHIPFVHPDLNQALSNEVYPVICDKEWILQIGMAEGNTNCFDLPKGHLDYGSRVGAYYFYLFPSTMLNFYPWGLSVNQILPQGIDSVMVKYQTYVLPGAKLANSAGAGLDKVELEDQEVVMRVQKGIGSRNYTRGRYSPKHEKGVYHFHQLISRALL